MPSRIVWDGRKLHGLNASGRSPAAWTPEYFRGKTGDAGARLGHGHRAGRRVGLGRAARANSASCRSRKLFEPAIGYGREGFLVSPTIAGQWASAGRRAEGPARLRRGVPAGRPRAARRASDSRSSSTPTALEKIAATQGRGVLSRRARRKLEARGDEARRRAARGRPRGAPARLGRAARDGLPRLHAARDPAQRPGHRGADRARHPRELRPALASRSTAPTACTCRSRR